MPASLLHAHARELFEHRGLDRHAQFVSDLRGCQKQSVRGADRAILIVGDQRRSLAAFMARAGARLPTVRVGIQAGALVVVVKSTRGRDHDTVRVAASSLSLI